MRAVFRSKMVTNMLVIGVVLPLAAGEGRDVGESLLILSHTADYLGLCYFLFKQWALRNSSATRMRRRRRSWWVLVAYPHKRTGAADDCLVPIITCCIELYQDLMITMPYPLPFGLLVCKQEAVFEESHRGQRANKDIQTMYDFIKTQTVNKDADYSVSVLHLSGHATAMGLALWRRR